MGPSSLSGSPQGGCILRACSLMLQGGSQRRRVIRAEALVAGTPSARPGAAWSAIWRADGHVMLGRRGTGGCP